MNTSGFGVWLAVAVSILCNRYVVRCSNYDEDTWIEPDAWTREQFSLGELGSDFRQCCKCAQDDTADNEITKSKASILEDTVSLIYLKKLIALLFDRKRLQYDPTLKVFERAMVFSIEPEKLKQLEQLQDPRDLDSILTDVFANVRVPNMYDEDQPESTNGMSVKALIVDILRDLFQLSKTSEMRFLVIALSALLCGWYVHRRYHIGWITMIVCGFLLFGYFHTYLECNRELEVKQMMEILERDKLMQKKQSDSRFMSFVKKIFYSAPSELQTQEESLKKASKLQLGFCRPDHVLIMYANDLFLKQVELLLEKCTITLVNLKDNLPFPYNYFAAIMVVAILAYVLKLTFKYVLSPRAWASVLHRPHTQPEHQHQHQHQQQQQQTQVPTIGFSGIGSITEDRISGDNLKMLLKAVSGSNIISRIGPSLTPSVSGVQEIVEPIEEAPPLKDSSPPIKDSSPPIRDSSMSASESDSPVSQNNNCCDKNLEEEAPVCLDDEPSDKEG